MKKKVLIISICLCLILIAAGGTIAYFTAESPIYHNVITTGGVDVELIEYRDREKKNPFEDVEGMMPGMSAGKVPVMINTGEKPAWVCIKVEKRIELAEGSDIREPDTGLIELDLNTSDWVTEDGVYYYYKHILKPGEETDPTLFTTVTIKGTMPNGYKRSKIMIDLTGYAVQSDHNGTDGDPLSVKGWPFK